jgi:PKD domain
LLGLAVRVRATPVEYRWDFGDGGELVTADPGAAYPDLRTTHTYAASGRRVITLSTVYRGEYSVAGGPWVPVDGTATVSSLPVPLQVLATRNHLVADPVT